MVVKKDTDLTLLGSDDEHRVGCLRRRQLREEDGRAWPGPQPSPVNDRHFFMELHGLHGENALLFAPTNPSRWDSGFARFVLDRGDGERAGFDLFLHTLEFLERQLTRVHQLGTLRRVVA